MANYNLTGQEIRNSYPQLGQVSGSIEGGVSGSAVVDGTGSRINTLHVTASQATNATSASFATTALSASYAPGTGVTSIIAGTGISVDQATGNVTVTNTQGAAATGSLLVTASNVDATITYTKGDGSTFQNIINNVANATEAEDLVITVKNTSGGTLAKGTAVHAVSVTGENVDVIAASNDSASAMPAIGILSQEITNNAAGTCIIAGRDTGLDTSGLVAGASVYVNLNGGLTSTKPTGSSLIQNIGTAAKIDASDGEIIVMGSGRSNDLPNITEGYAWVGDTNGVPQAVATSSFAGDSFPFTGNAQITGSLVVSQSGLSSGEDVFVLGAPRGGGSSLEGVIRSTVDDGLHFYGNKAFNTGANTFGGGQIYFEAGPINVGSAGSPVSLDMQNGSAITASNGTLPIKGDVDVDGNIAIEGTGTTLTVGDATSPAGTPNVNLKQNYSGSTSVFANITIDDTSGTYARPTLIGRFSNANSIGNVAGDPYTVIAGGADGGEFLHWGLVMDQSGDLKLLKEVAMRSGANITGSLDVSGAITASNASFQSASIGYLQTITGSATIIGSQYVVLNADSPTARFAGIKVYDSGSGLTGSFEWDSVDDNWIQVETGGSSAGMLTGASGSKGSETYPTNNTLLKGTGNHTVVDSIITDDGSSISVTGAITSSKGLTVTGFNETSTFNGTITSTQGSIQALGGNGGNALSVGNSGYGLQYPSVNVFTNSGSYGDVYASHRIEDLSGNGDFGTLALSTFNAGDPGRLAFETQFNNDVIWWISENENRFHVEKELKAKAGAQITGSLTSSGSTLNLFTDTATTNGQTVKALEFSNNTSNRGNVYDSNYIGSMNYTALGDKTDKALTMWKGASNLSEYGFIYNNGNTMGMYMNNVSGSTGDVSLFTDHGGSGDANFRILADNVEIDPRSSFKIDGTSAFTDIEIGRSSISSFKLVTDEVNAIQITGSLDVTGGLDINGQVTGAVTSLAIASTTASMDFNSGNFFNLTLANGVDTHLDATNVVAGQTITLVVTNNATGAGTLSFSPDFKFSEGTAPTVTAAVDAVDILTFVTTDATSVYGTGLLNFS